MTTNPPSMALLVLIILLPPRLSYAETKILTVEATYTMGEGETITFAEAMVLQRAKQIALEQAGTYVESYTRVINYQLSADEIQTIAGGVLEAEVLEKNRILVGDGLLFFVKIKATVTTDRIGILAARLKAKNAAEDYQRLQGIYHHIAQEVEQIKQLLKQGPSPETRERLLARLQASERDLLANQANEADLFRRLAQEARDQVSMAQSDAESVEGLMRWLVEHGYQIISGTPAIEPLSDRPGYAKLTIPVSIALTPEARDRIKAVTSQLGGVEDVFEDSWFSFLRHRPDCGFPSDRLPPLARPIMISSKPDVQRRWADLVAAQTLSIMAIATDGSILMTFTQQAADHNLETRRCSRASDKSPTYRLLGPHALQSMGKNQPNWNPLEFPLYPSLTNYPTSMLLDNNQAAMKLTQGRPVDVFLLDDPVRFALTTTILIQAVEKIQAIKGNVILEKTP